MSALWRWLRGLIYRPQHGAPAGLDWPDAEPEAWQRDPDTLDMIALPISRSGSKLGELRVSRAYTVPAPRRPADNAPAAAATQPAAAAGHQPGILPPVLWRSHLQLYAQAWRAEAREHHDRIAAERHAWRRAMGLPALLEAVAA